MNTLKDYVDWKLTHSTRFGSMTGYPLVLEKCKTNKKMKELKVWGNNKNLFHAGLTVYRLTDIVSNSVVITDNSFSGTISNKNTNGVCYIIIKIGRAIEYAGKTIYVTFTCSDSAYMYSNYTTLVVYNSAGAIEGSRYAIKDGIYYSYITIPEDIDETGVLTFRLYKKPNAVDTLLAAYDVMIYEGTEPLPYEPYIDGCVGEKTVNLYDAKTYRMTGGTWINANTGSISYYEEFSATGSIPCSELRGKTITVGPGAGTNVGIAFYDENKSYISGKPYSQKTSLTVVVPDNAVYLRFSTSTAKKHEVGIYECATLLTFEPYGYKIPIVQKGKNLLNMMQGYNWSGSSRLGVYDNGHLWKGNISSSTVQYVASAGWVSFNDGHMQKFPIIKGKSITISVDVTPIEKHDETRKTATKFLCLVYKGTTEVKTFSSSEFPLEIGVKSHLSYTFTPSNYEGDSLRVIVYLCSHTMKIENLQVEYGSADTPYEPYVEPITHNVYVDEPLSANDVLDVKAHMELPILTSKTTVFTTDTTTPPSNMYGRYVKR